VQVIRGPDPAGFDELLATDWEVGIRSNRQGIRLDGPSLPGHSGAMLSRPVTWGTIQLPPDGQPIVLLADAQTVGGYPVVAVVISADRPLIGQLGPTDTVRFVEVTVAQAQRAFRQQAATFQLLRAEIRAV
jgi:antagonist of KipI